MRFPVPGHPDWSVGALLPRPPRPRFVLLGPPGGYGTELGLHWCSDGWRPGHLFLPRRGLAKPVPWEGGPATLAEVLRASLPLLPGVPDGLAEAVAEALSDPAGLLLAVEVMRS